LLAERGKTRNPTRNTTRKWLRVMPLDDRAVVAATVPLQPETQRARGHADPSSTAVPMLVNPVPGDSRPSQITSNLLRSGKRGTRLRQRGGERADVSPYPDASQNRL